MDKIIAIFGFFTALGVIIVTIPEGNVAILVVAILSTLAIILIRQNYEDSGFLINIFLVALIARILFGTFLHVYELREYFGSDALSFDYYGIRLVEIWFYNSPTNDIFSQKALSTSTPGWGIKLSDRYSLHNYRTKYFSRTVFLCRFRSGNRAAGLYLRSQDFS